MFLISLSINKQELPVFNNASRPETGNSPKRTTKNNKEQQTNTTNKHKNKHKNNQRNPKKYKKNYKFSMFLIFETNNEDFNFISSTSFLS